MAGGGVEPSTFRVSVGVSTVSGFHYDSLLTEVLRSICAKLVRDTEVGQYHQCTYGAGDGIKSWRVVTLMSKARSLISVRFLAIGKPLWRTESQHKGGDQSQNE